MSTKAVTLRSPGAKTASAKKTKTTSRPRKASRVPKTIDDTPWNHREPDTDDEDDEVVCDDHSSDESDASEHPSEEEYYTDSDDEEGVPLPSAETPVPAAMDNESPSTSAAPNLHAEDSAAAAGLADTASAPAQSLSNAVTAVAAVSAQQQPEAPTHCTTAYDVAHNHPASLQDAAASHELQAERLMHEAVRTLEVGLRGKADLAEQKEALAKAAAEDAKAAAGKQAKALGDAAQAEKAEKSALAATQQSADRIADLQRQLAEAAKVHEERKAHHSAAQGAVQAAQKAAAEALAMAAAAAKAKEAALSEAQGARAAVLGTEKKLADLKLLLSACATTEPPRLTTTTNNANADVNAATAALAAAAAGGPAELAAAHQQPLEAPATAPSGGNKRTRGAVEGAPEGSAAAAKRQRPEPAPENRPLSAAAAPDAVAAAPPQPARQRAVPLWTPGEPRLEGARALEVRKALKRFCVTAGMASPCNNYLQGAWCPDACRYAHIEGFHRCIASGACHICLERGHERSKCEAVICRYCEKQGHKTHECPLRSQQQRGR